MWTSLLQIQKQHSIFMEYLKELIGKLYEDKSIEAKFIVMDEYVDS